MEKLIAKNTAKNAASEDEIKLIKKRVKDLKS